MVTDESYIWELIVEYHGIGSIADKCHQEKGIATHRIGSSTSKPVSQSLNLADRETEHIKTLSNSIYWNRRIISSALQADDYRLHFTLQLSEVNLSCTLQAISINQTPTYIDHLLSQDRTKSSKRKNVKMTEISSRLVLVRVNYCKDVGKNVPVNKQNTLDNLRGKEQTDFLDPCTSLAQNGFVYLGHRYRYLLSKDPREKVAYFLRDDFTSVTFPDAQTVRNFIADFTSQPAIFRSGMI